MSETAPQSDPSHYRLKVSSYEQVASMLLALVGLLGTAVLLMLIVWLTSRIFLTQAAVPVEMIELGDGDGPLGGDNQLEGPLDEEIELMEPSVQDTLAAVADAVAAQTALLDDPSLSKSDKRGRGGGGKGLGMGDGTGSGMARKWNIYYEKDSLTVYAKQLDWFGIELAVLMPDNKISYAKNLSKPRPDTRTAPADQEKRWHFIWRDRARQEIDRELLRKAGIESRGRIVLQFIPREVEATLQNLERQHKGSDPNRSRTTRFGVRPRGDGYEFFVIS